jgi:BirA family biotin operon repressor/biotin-[acetyl-CoA-carboxylase] ligase
VPVDLPAGYRLIQLDETGSTNADALAAAQRGEPGGLWIAARRQTAGKGSRGRSWSSLAGNLLASLLLDDPSEARNLPELTFVASLAVHAAIAGLSAGRRADIRTKWPNDILVGGRKVSGILLESHHAAGRQAVIIGIGVNCAAHPVETLHPATSLAQEGITVDADAMLGALAHHFARYLQLWDRGNGFAAIRAAWLAHAAGLGERIVVRMPQGEYCGVFADIAADGNLVLLPDGGGEMRISTADIFFPAQTGKGQHTA